MLSCYCVFFRQCLQLTGQTGLTSSVSLTAAVSEIWVFFRSLTFSFLHLLQSGTLFVQGLEVITNRRCFEFIEVSVFMVCCMPVYFSFQGFDICILSLSWPRLKWSDFHVGWYALWRRAVWRHCAVFRSTSQMLWCPSNSIRWLLYTSDSVMISISRCHSRLWRCVL
jgi:hypothetical protein